MGQKAINGWNKLKQAGMEWNRRVQARISPFQHILAYSCIFPPILAYSNIFQPIQSIQAYFSPIKPIPAYSSLFQTIPACSSIFQPMAAYSSLFSNPQSPIPKFLKFEIANCEFYPQLEILSVSSLIRISQFLLISQSKIYFIKPFGVVLPITGPKLLYIKIGLCNF